MSEYKRFVSYVYEYRNGEKKHSCGFCRAEVRGGQCKLELHMKFSPFPYTPTFQVYTFAAGKERPVGIPLGEAAYTRGTVYGLFHLPARGIGGRYDFQQLGGLIVQSDTGGLYATSWTDLPFNPENFLVQEDALENTPEIGSESDAESISGNTEPAAKPTQKAASDMAAISIPKNASDGTAKSIPESAPDGTAKFIPENTPGSTAKFIPENTPGSAAKFIPENTPDSAAEHTPENTSDNATEYTPESSPDITAEGSPDGAMKSAPEVSPDNTAKSAPESAPNIAAKSAPGNSPAPAAPSEIPPGSTSPATAESAPESVRAASVETEGEIVPEELSVPSGQYNPPSANQEKPLRTMTSRSNSPKIPPIRNRRPASVSPDPSGESLLRQASVPFSPHRFTGGPIPTPEEIQAGISRTTSHVIYPESPGQSRESQNSHRAENADISRNFPEDTEEAQECQEDADPPARPAFSSRNRESWRRLQDCYPHIQPFSDGQIHQCLQLTMKDLAELRKNSWFIGSNQFLARGCQQYHHFLLGVFRDDNGQDSGWVLGIPGIYDEKERFLAGMFGFPNFKPSRESSIRSGQFGYWYRFLY
ncbi:MAG TPA: hypothetical protein IAA63_11680 [Candidatus Pullilachnospira stercoravium]|uniref:Uncharacterized protein n=1 Tax=Candidatus Pullilachnospira stercoravium TaxID=2840913 RepID=A0A9D1T7C9_9FIRM|nr:hypothetical protein [Candidatus Pullilachnospira stercoravium]